MSATLNERQELSLLGGHSEGWSSFRSDAITGDFEVRSDRLESAIEFYNGIYERRFLHLLWYCFVYFNRNIAGSDIGITAFTTEAISISIRTRRE